MKYYFYILAILILVHSDSAIGSCSNFTIVEKLTTALLSDYEREQRPNSLSTPGENTTVTKIAIALNVRHGRIDQVTANAVVLADLYMAWFDPRLTWNATEWGISSAYFSADSIWHPDMVLMNAAHITESDEPVNVGVDNEGDALWVPRMKWTAPCKLDLEYWPRDEHKCRFELGSKSYSEKEVSYFFHPYSMEDAPERATGDWYAQKAKQVYISREGQRYPAVEWTVSLQRRWGAHTATSAAVTATVVLLLLGALLVDPHVRSGAVMAAAGVALVQLVSTAHQLPAGVGVPRVLRLYAGLLGTSAASVMWSALVVYVAGLESRAGPIVRGILVRTARITGYRDTLGAEESPEVEIRSKRRDYVTLARLLDMLLSMVTTLVTVVLLACYMNR